MKAFNNLSKKPPQIVSIPQGLFCCDNEDVCPYWSIQHYKPAHENGYCHFLEKGDGSFTNTSRLWNLVKQCNIFTETNEYDDLNKNIFQKFITKLLLFQTISKNYNFLKRTYIMLTGKICRCKFCRKYFIQLKNVSNLTQCKNCSRKEGDAFDE